MQSIWQSKGEKIHARHIDVATYDYDGQRIIVEGTLKDDRFQKSHMLTGETVSSGVIHHMVIRLLVNCSSLLIEDVDVEMISIPRDVCRETMDCLAPVKGLTIAKGFTAKVKKMAGGQKGCTHLVELLLAMASAAVQGYAAYQAKTPADFNPDQTKMIMQFLINTCYAWREDGPFVEMFKKKYKM